MTLDCDYFFYPLLVLLLGGRHRSKLHSNKTKKILQRLNRRFLKTQDEQSSECSRLNWWIEALTTCGKESQKVIYFPSLNSRLTAVRAAPQNMEKFMTIFFCFFLSFLKFIFISSRSFFRLLRMPLSAWVGEKRSCKYFHKFGLRGGGEGKRFRYYVGFVSRARRGCLTEHGSP